MRIQKVNWYGFLHEKVSEHYGGAEFINTFCVRGEYEPVAVYKAKNPDRSKGHKDYLLLQIISPVPGGDERVMLVRGMDRKEINEYRYQDAIYCKRCDEVIFSVMRHDARHCSCGGALVDGGADYLRYGGDQELLEVVILDFLTDTVVPDRTNPIPC